MHTEAITSFSNWRPRKPVAVLLVVAVLAVTMPAAGAASALAPGDPALPMELLVRNGSGLFRIDLSELWEHREAVMQGNGSMTVRVDKAILADEEAGDEPPGFSYYDPTEPSPSDFEILDLDRERSDGTNPEFEVAGWREVVSATVISTPLTISSEYRVGDDRMTIVLPRRLLDASAVVGDADAVEVLVNGFAWSADPGFVYDAARTLSEEGLVPEFDTPEELIDLLDRFHDRNRFVNSAMGLEMILAVLAERLEDWIRDDPDGCFWDCTLCGATLAAYGLSLTGLVLACGATLGAGCVLAFLGVSFSKVGVAKSCVDCGGCLEKKKVQEKLIMETDGCPCKGQPNCDCA